MDPKRPRPTRAGRLQRAMHALRLLGSALVLSTSLVAQGRHVFDVDSSATSLALSGNVTVAGIVQNLIITPSTTTLNGSFAADLTGSTSINTGQLVASEGVSLTLPPLTAIVPNILPILPPLLTVTTTPIEFELESADAMFNPITFPVAPNGTFSTTVQLRGISGSATASGLVNQTISLVDQRSDATPLNGTLTFGPDGFAMSLPLMSTFPLTVGTDMASLTLNGTINASDRSLAADLLTLTAPVGGTQTMTLSAGQANAGRDFFLGTSAAGTMPGFALPNGGPIMPLNVDGFFIASLEGANVFPWGNNLGTLDGLGRATTTFSLPPLPGFQGLTFDHAFFTFQGGNFLSVSNTVPLALN